MSPKSARDKLREYFENHIGEILSTEKLRAVAEISEYARRIRELRDDEGMQILTHNDRVDLKPGEYLLETRKRLPVIGRKITSATRTRILERNGFTCQLCGAGAGDPDPVNPDRTVRLHIDHTSPLAQEGDNEEENLRVLCSNCNQGIGAVRPPSETALNILMRIRKLPRSEQQEIYEALKKKFDR